VGWRRWIVAVERGGGADARAAVTLVPLVIPGVAVVPAAQTLKLFCNNQYMIDRSWY
jgi:hypothetical protein